MIGQLPVSQGSKDVLVKKNENYKGFQGWKQTIRQINHFKKLFIGSDWHCYSPFRQQHSSQAKGFCECPVGICGRCCHVIVILLQLEHLTHFNELFLSLTCTQKLQKWHRPTKCSKSKITTACHIRLKYFRNARSARQVVNTKKAKKDCYFTGKSRLLQTRDQSDWLKRDVSQMSSKVSDGISKCNVDVSNHFLQTLQKYGIKQSGLYSHLSYRSAYLCEIIHKEHDYAKQTPTNDEGIFKPTFTAKSEDIWHRALVTSDAKKSNTDISTDHYTSTDSV